MTFNPASTDSEANKVKVDIPFTDTLGMTSLTIEIEVVVFEYSFFQFRTVSVTLKKEMNI